MEFVGDCLGFIGIGVDGGEGWVSGVGFID